MGAYRPHIRPRWAAAELRLPCILATYGHQAKPGLGDGGGWWCSYRHFSRAHDVPFDATEAFLANRKSRGEQTPSIASTPKDIFLSPQPAVRQKRQSVTFKTTRGKVWGIYLGKIPPSGRSHCGDFGGYACNEYLLPDGQRWRVGKVC